MTLSKALRDEARRKLGGITTQALNSRVRTKCRKEKIADLDIGLLLVAFEDAGIIVSKPQYRVPSEKLKVFQDHLDSKKNTTVPTEVVRAFKKIEKAKPPKGPNLLSFKGKTPRIRITSSIANWKTRSIQHTETRGSRMPPWYCRGSSWRICYSICFSTSLHPRG